MQALGPDVGELTTSLGLGELSKPLDDTLQTVGTDVKRAPQDQAGPLLVS